MKKFSFPLDTVLSYKTEVLESIRNEHGKILKRVSDQETYIEELNRRYREYNQEFNEKKRTGISIINAQMYEMYLRELEHDIKLETRKLAALQAEAEKKRLEVVEAKKETSSIEKLKEKKIEQYRKDLQKNEELIIEEFVSNSRMANQ